MPQLAVVMGWNIATDGDGVGGVETEKGLTKETNRMAVGKKGALERALLSHASDCQHGESRSNKWKGAA